MLTPPFQAGSKVTAAGLDAAVPLAAYKFADQNAGQSNTTLVADIDLQLALNAGATYSGMGLIVYSAATAADYKCTMTAPAGAVGGFDPNPYNGSGGSAYVLTNAFLAFGTTLKAAGQGTGTNASFSFRFSVVMGATAGNLVWEFAQGTSDASNLNTRAYSYLLAWQVA